MRQLAVYLSYHEQDLKKTDADFMTCIEKIQTGVFCDNNKN